MIHHLPRRVVTGLDAQGRSAVIIDGPVAPVSAFGGIAWHAPGAVADNSGTDDAAPAEFSFDLMHAGTTFMHHTYEPGHGEFWHATNTVEYIVMLEGEVVLMLESGEVTLREGDFAVDRGVNHCWRNDSGRPARAAIVSIPAHPVGKGRTV